MKEINNLSSGASIIIDANIIIYAITKYSKQCEDFIYGCSVGKYIGVCPSHILAEVMHRLMLLEAKSFGMLQGANPAKKLSENSNLIKSLSEYKDKINFLMNIGLIIEPIIKQDYSTALELQTLYGLMTNDSLLVSTALRLNIKNIATSDLAFNSLKAFTVHSPSDLPH